VLGIETARAGSATGEVTSVLRTLPSHAQRRVPFRVRHPAVAVVIALAVVALVGGGATWLATRAHHGTGTLPQPAPKATPHQVGLCDSCAHDYNPLAPVGPKNQNPGEVGLAIDGDRNTAWNTEQYYNGLQKPGVGIYVTASPAVAAHSMIIDTDTPGYSVVIYARLKQPNPDLFDVGPTGWVKVGAAPFLHSTQTIPLNTGGVGYHYYLAWITSLGKGEYVAVNEIALYT
jgi:eukaryotic-like serine/threonine-protein kinase